MNSVELKFKVDIKSIRKAFVLLDLDVPPDEEIQSKLSEVVVDLSAINHEDMNQAKLAFSMIAIGSAYEKIHNM